MSYEFDLKDVKTKEVSLVDRAAIKRTFLLVKRKEGAMGGQGQGPGMEGPDGKTVVSSSVLKAVIQMAKPAIERLVSLASEMEEMQGVGEEGDPTTDKQEGSQLSKEIATEFRAIMGILESVLQKYPSAAQKNNDLDPDGKGDRDLENAELVKSIEDLTVNLKALSVKIEELEKKAATPPPPPVSDSDVAPVKKDAESDASKETRAELTKSLGETKEEVKKMLDTRGVELTKMFQDAAKEEFGKVVSRVEAIEKALTGDDTGKPPTGKKEDYKRTYGSEDVDSKVTEESNPFVSMFESVKDF